MQRTIRLLSLFNFLTDFSLFAPIAVIYYSRVAGSFALGMSIFSIVALASAALEIPTGVFSDRIGRKQTMIVGTCMGILSGISYAIGLSYIWLVIGAIFEGTARSFYSGNNEAYLHDILKDHNAEHEYHVFLGKVSAMFQVALAISALLGSIIAQWSFHAVLWLSVVPTVIKLFISFFFLEPKKREHVSTNIYAHIGEAIKLFWTNKQLRILSISGMLTEAMSESQFQFRAAFVSTLWPIWAIGLSNMISNIGAAVSFYFSGAIIKKYREFKTIIWSNIFSRVCNLTALLLPTVASPAIMATTSIVYGASSVARENLLQKEFTEHQRATMGSLNSLGGSLLFAAMSFILGFTADQLSPMKGLIIFQVLSFIPFCLFLLLVLPNRFRINRTH